MVFKRPFGSGTNVDVLRAMETTNPKKSEAQTEREMVQAEKKIEKMTHPSALTPSRGGVVAGAVVGAAAGGFSGPPGMALGAVVGSLIGLAVGETLETDMEQTEKHNQELDEELGITSGAIGVDHDLLPQNLEDVEPKRDSEKAKLKPDQQHTKQAERNDHPNNHGMVMVSITDETTSFHRLNE
jgi:phage tail tape-measure protein